MVHLDAVIKSYDAQRRPGNENAQENKDHSQPVRHCPNIVLSKRNLKLGRELCVVRPTTGSSSIKPQSASSELTANILITAAIALIQHLLKRARSPSGNLPQSPAKTNALGHTVTYESPLCSRARIFK